MDAGSSMRAVKKDDREIMNNLEAFDLTGWRTRRRAWSGVIRRPCGAG
jgi:hypothetical protein